jgi:hypothetical protein
MTKSREKIDRPAQEQSTMHFNTPENQALEFVQQNQGQPLDTSAREIIEPKFAHNFADIRVFADGQAPDLANKLDARAFTIGQNIVFGANEYQPHSRDGQGLLAHELAHTVQQRNVDPKNVKHLEIADRNSGIETEARAASTNVLAGQGVPGFSSSGAVIAREGKDEKKDDSLEHVAEFYERLHLLTDAGEMIGGEKSIVKDLGKPLGMVSNATNAAAGVKKLLNGDLREGGVQTARSVLDLTDHGILSNGIGLVDGYDKVHSDDLPTATDGAQEMLEGVFGMGESVGKKIPGPVGKWVEGAAKAGGVGAKVGKKWVDWANGDGKERGQYGQNIYGENRTGSEEAADAGRDVRDYVNSNKYIPNVIGDVLGGAATIEKSWYNTGATTARWAGRKVTDGAKAVGNAASWTGGKIADGAEAVGDAASWTGGKVADGAEAVGDAASWAGGKAEAAWDAGGDALNSAGDFLFGGPNIMETMQKQLEEKQSEQNQKDIQERLKKMSPEELQQFQKMQSHWSSMMQPAKKPD